MEFPDAASVGVKGFVAPLLLWRGWETNKSEVDRLRDFLDYGQGLLNDVEHLAVEDFEDLQIDLNSVRTGFLNLQRKPAVLRWSGYTQYAEDLAALKCRVEVVAQRFGQRLNIDTSRKMTTIERYQRKLLRESRQTQGMVEEIKQEIKRPVGGASSDMVKEMTKKIEENLRLSADAQDALARAKQAEKDLEEQVQHNARLEERLESARLDVARCQEAVAAAEAKAKRCESVSAELEAELRLLRQDVTKAEQRLQALSDDLAESNDRVDKARTRVREMEKEIANKQKAISATYARLTELRAWSLSRKAAADHEMREFKKVAEARLKEEVDKNGLLSDKVQMLQRELQEARQEATRYRARLAQLGNPVTISEEQTEARPRPAGHHGLEEQELAARPDQNKTLSTAAPAAGGAPATAAAAAAAPSKHGKHEQMPAPYHTIPAEVDRNNPKKNADGRGRPDSSQQALKQRESKQITRAERLMLAKRCVALFQIFVPDVNLDTVLLLPREAFLRHGRMPTFEEARPHLRPVLALAAEEMYAMSPRKAVYLSHAQGDHLEKDWVAAAKAKAMAAGGAVAVAVAAAAAGAAEAATGAAIAKRAAAAGGAADLYATARAFLLENPEFQLVWVSAACMPPRLREQKWRGAVPSTAGSNVFEHLHPGALLVCDAMLVALPERGSLPYVAEMTERYTDLEASMSPWRTLERVIAEQVNSATFYTFRLGEKLIFIRGDRRGGESVEGAVWEALKSESPPERNWRGTLRPCLVLEKAREEVEKHNEANGALKQAILTMSVSMDQAEEFFVTWKLLGALGPHAPNDRLAALNLLLFSVSVTDGLCCPRRPRDFVKRMMDESLATPEHLDLWMKDLSPDDSRNILRRVNAGEKKLSVLTIGSSHTGGAGVGTFLRGHPTLKELELEWEGIRDLSSIAHALADHKSLIRLNLAHNKIGRRGAIQLANTLRINKSLTELDLRENSLGLAVKAIADALASNDTMRTLYLQDNAIDDDGVIAITEALMRNGRLRTICLDGNKVGAEGAKVICIAVKMNLALKVISLSRNSLPDDAKRELYDAWSQRETEDGLTRSGMFLEQAADGTLSEERVGLQNGLPPVEGELARPGGGTGGRGVLVSLVSPTAARGTSISGS